MKKINILLLLFLFIFANQCNVINDDKLDNPNSVSPVNVNPDFLLNNIQLNARNVFSSITGTGSDMTRMMHMFGSTYGDAYNPISFNNLYTTAYSGLMIDVQNLLPIVQERQLYFHSGIAKALQAYTLIALVDAYGDIPYSEALDATNFNPMLDDGESVYAQAIILLDEAIADFENEDRRGFPSVDMYYTDLTGSEKVSAWVRFANTVKLKAYLNTGDADAVNNILENDVIISEQEYDFTFAYGSNDINPDTRHPDYADNYDQGTANSYMAVNYMNMLLNDKSIADPRLRYYMYRQVTSDPTDFNENSCITEFPPAHFQLDDPFCLLGDGWWGRDHLINDGIPPDGGLRTTFGVFPAGGQFDNDQGETVSKGMGLAGVGIRPILMSYHVWYMVAEAELTLNNNVGAAYDALATAIDLSMSTVADFGSNLAAGTPYEITPDGIDAYLEIISERWTTFSDKDDLESVDEYYLRQIAKEFYFALWGNGYEAYNLMRRTGYPNRIDNLQPARVPSPGIWYRSFLYPSNMVERNSNISQKTDVSIGPFWDKGEGSFNY